MLKPGSQSEVQNRAPAVCRLQRALLELPPISHSSVITPFPASAALVPPSNAPTESWGVSRDTLLSQTRHQWNNWTLFGGIYYRGRSCVGGVGADIKGLRGPEPPRAGLIEPARWESESGRRMFESCSWDPDDRVVFGNLRARAQKWASPHRGVGQEGRLWLSKHPQLYLYYIFSSPGLFQREERTVFRFPTLWPLSFISPLLSDNVCASGAPLTPGLHVRTLLATERCIQSVAERGESHRRLQDCFGSPVFQCGSTNRGGIARRTMAPQPWNSCTMTGPLLRPSMVPPLLWL